MRCLECYNFTALSGTTIFNVSYTGANYSVGIAPRSKTRVNLNSGWNLFSLTLNNTVNSTDIEIPVAAGWNLVGYSSDNETLQSNIDFVNGSGNEDTWRNAVRDNKVKNTFAYYDSSSGNKKFKYAPYDDTSLRQNKGYWVYASEAGNMSIDGVGGSPTGGTYAWSDLMFENASGTTLNITDAVSAEWILPTLKYYNATFSSFRNIESVASPSVGIKSNISSWEGVFAYSLKDNITMLRQD